MLNAQVGGQQLSLNVSLAGQTYFQAGDVARPYVMGATGATTFAGFGTTGTALARRTAFEAVANAGRNSTSNTLYERSFATVQQRAVQFADRVNACDRRRAPVRALPDAGVTLSPLQQQLRTVAKLISARASLSMSRQVFFVSTGGFDTHDDQVADQPGLLANVSNSIKTFFDALAEVGMENSVTLFTHSDFGRTLTSNGDGSDHAWGGVQFVVGGAVRGQQVYGQYPLLRSAARRTSAAGASSRPPRRTSTPRRSRAGSACRTPTSPRSRRTSATSRRATSGSSAEGEVRRRDRGVAIVRPRRVRVAGLVGVPRARGALRWTRHERSLAAIAASLPELRDRAPRIEGADPVVPTPFRVARRPARRSAPRRRTATLGELRGLRPQQARVDLAGHRGADLVPLAEGGRRAVPGAARRAADDGDLSVRGRTLDPPSRALPRLRGNLALLGCEDRAASIAAAVARWPSFASKTRSPRPGSAARAAQRGRMVRAPAGQASPTPRWSNW